MIDYLQNVIEQPSPVFGGLPICPFSRQARIHHRILYKLFPFSASDLDPQSELFQVIQDFGHRSEYDLMLVIHPNPQALTLEEMHDFTARLNELLQPFELISFDGHPLDPFNIQGVYTRKAPYIHFTVQTMQKVKQASDALLKTAYYSHWTQESLKLVGMPRN